MRLPFVTKLFCVTFISKSPLVFAVMLVLFFAITVPIASIVRAIFFSIGFMIFTETVDAKIGIVIKIDTITVLNIDYSFYFSYLKSMISK